MNSSNTSSSAEILNQWKKADLVLGRWKQKEFIFALIPPFVAFVATGLFSVLLRSRAMTIIGLASTVLLAGLGAILLAIEPSHLSIGEFVLQRTHWLTRQPIKLHARDDAIDGTEQPPNKHPRARQILSSVPPANRFIAPEEDERTQDLVPVERLHPGPGHQAIELDNGLLIAMVDVNPANLSTATASDWDRRIGQLDEALSTHIDFEIQHVSTVRPLDHGEYREEYHQLKQDRPDPEDVSGMQKLRAKLLEERVGVIESDHENVHLREDYYLVKLHPGELVESTDEGASFFGSITNAPIIGSHVRRRRLKKRMEDQRELREELLTELRDRLGRMTSVANRVDGVSAHRASLADLTRALITHYKADVDAYDLSDEDLRALIHGSPAIDATFDPDSADGDSESNSDDEQDRQHGYEEDVLTDYAINVEVSQSNVPDGTVVDYDTEDERMDRIVERFRSLVSPEATNSEDPRYLVLDESEYVAGLWIDDWPDSPNRKMFSRVISDPEVHVTLSTHAVGIPRREAEDTARNEKIDAKTEMDKKDREGSWGFHRAKRRYESALDVESLLNESNSGLFLVSTYVLIRADDEETLLKHVDRIKRRLRDKPARTDPVGGFYQQEKMLECTAPLGLDPLAKVTPMLGSGLAKQMTYATSNIHEPSGIEFGVHHDRNEPTIVDPFAREMGYNMAAFGKVGSGKSTTTKKIVTELKERHPEYNINFLDPLEGLSGPANTFESARIPIGGDVGLNVLEIEPTPEEKLDAIGQTAPFQVAMDRGMSFVETYYDLEGLSLQRKKGVWQTAMKEAYADAGITPDPATHANESPTLRDVIEKINEISRHPEEYTWDSSAEWADEDDWQDSGVDEGLADKRRETAQRILNEDVDAFKRGGKYANLAKPTGFDLAESDSAYLDMQLREAKGETGLMLGLALTAVYEQAKTSDAPTVVLIDEAHYVTKHADNLAFLEQVLRHSRHHDISLIFSTQSITEFFERNEHGELQLRESASVLIDNMSILMFHHLDEMNTEVGAELGLNPREAKFVSDALPGSEKQGYAEMLLAVDEDGQRECYPQRVEMSRKANPVEFAIVDYEPSDHGPWHDYLKAYLGESFADSADSATVREQQASSDDFGPGPNPGPGPGPGDDSRSPTPTDQTEEATTDGGENTATALESSLADRDQESRVEADTASPTPDADSVPPLTTITGVGEVKAEALRAVGIHTPGDVRTATVETLAKADGIGLTTGERIRERALATETAQGGDD